jgi:hypothetical protein
MEEIPVVYYITKDFLDLTLKSIEYIDKFHTNKIDYSIKYYIISTDNLALPDGVELLKVDIDNPTGLFLIDRLKILGLLYKIVGRKRVIFLDSDTIVMTCITRLWEKNIAGNAAGGCVHYHYNIFNDLLIENKLLEISTKLKNSPFYNCGVFIINTEKWLKDNISDKALNTWQMYKDNKYYMKWDEPALNVALANNIQSIDDRWNCHPEKHMNYARRDRTYILHYYGSAITNIPKYDWTTKSIQ